MNDQSEFDGMPARPWDASSWLDEYVPLHPILGHTTTHWLEQAFMDAPRSLFPSHELLQRRWFNEQIPAHLKRRGIRVVAADEVVPVLDPETNEPLMDETNEPLVKTRRMRRFRDPLQLSFADAYESWRVDMRRANQDQRAVRARIEEYATAHPDLGLDVEATFTKLQDEVA